MEEEEGASLRQDLEELHGDLMQLMEKHGVAGEVFDEKYELRKPVTKPARANLSTLDTFPCFSSHSSIMALINPGYKDNVPSTIMSLFPLLSSSKMMTTMEIMTLAPPYLDTLPYCP